MADPKPPTPGFNAIEPKGPSSLSRRSGPTVFDIDLHSQLSGSNTESTVFQGINTAKKLRHNYVRIITGYGLHGGSRAKLGATYQEIWRPDGVLDRLSQKSKITQWVPQEGNPGAVIVKIQ